MDIKIEFRFRVRREQVKQFLEEYSHYLDVGDLIDMGINKFQIGHFVLLKTPLLPVTEFEKIKENIVLITEKYAVTTSMEITNLTNLRMGKQQ